MKNPAPYIRTSLVALLNNTITYNSLPVPCYEGGGEVTPYQILIEDTTDRTVRIRDTFSYRFEQVIEVVSEQQTNLRKHVDAIGGEVMNKILPTPMTKGISNNSDFQIASIEKIGQRYLDEASGQETFINRLILRYEFLIVEK